MTWTSEPIVFSLVIDGAGKMRAFLAESVELVLTRSNQDATIGGRRVAEQLHAAR
jgi:hypothetical protein